MTVVEKGDLLIAAIERGIGDDAAVPSASEYEDEEFS